MNAMARQINNNQMMTIEGVLKVYFNRNVRRESAKNAMLDY